MFSSEAPAKNVKEHLLGLRGAKLLVILSINFWFHMIGPKNKIVCISV